MKKIIPYILISSVLMGLFGPVFQAQAQVSGTCTQPDGTVFPDVLDTNCPAPAKWAANTTTPTVPSVGGTCTVLDTEGKAMRPVHLDKKTDCDVLQNSINKNQKGVWNPDSDPTGGGAVLTSQPILGSCATGSGVKTGVTRESCTGEWTPDTNPGGDSALSSELESCAKLFIGLPSGLYGCVEQATYFLFVTVPSFLVTIAANIFNFVISLAVSSHMYSLDFIGKIWKIVRDFANIFFILILLYAAFQIILDLGHGGGRKIIGSVILVALLVNFSLFFTKVVIDSSNIVALIFYNRVDTSDVATYQKISNEAQTGVPEKDIAGALVSKFNINTFFSKSLLDSMQRENRLFGLSSAISPFTLVSMMVVYGLVVYALTYAFFIAGMSFLGRMINLMMLMIISPFAFVSASVPKFKGINTIGFDSWISKLFESSFVAAVFMFILYLISQILSAKIFDSVSDKNNTSLISTMVLLFVPAILIVILLLKGAKYAQKASGEFSNGVISGAKVLGGLAIGGAALGVAGVARGTVGSFMKGASTGDSINQRYARGEIQRANFGAGWKGDLAYRSSLAKGAIAHYSTATLLTRAQRGAGGFINRDQTRVESYAHARHELDKASEARFRGKKFKDLSGPERDIIRTRVSRDEESRAQHGKVYNDVTDVQKASVDAVVGADIHGNAIAGGLLETHQSHADHLINEARGKQGTISSVMQASRTGTYDVRGIADAVAKEYNTGFAKLATGLTATIASSLRGGFKQVGVNYGTPQGSFFKDLGNTISEALKSAKINVDLSHVGEEKKESKGGGH